MIAGRRDSVEAVEFKRYTGRCVATVVAVNPSKEDYEKLTGAKLQNDLVYTKQNQAENGVMFNSTNVRVMLKPVVEGLPLMALNIFVEDRDEENADHTKKRIIDVYGRATWATNEEIAAGKIPVSKNGNPLNISEGYRVAKVGEVKLTNFLRAYLNIPSHDVWDQQAQRFVANSDLKSCECRIDDMKAICAGNLTEIKAAIATGIATNTTDKPQKVAVMLGVRDGQDGKQYQTVCDEQFYSPAARSFKDWDNVIERLCGPDGKYHYSYGEVLEYSVKPTTFVPTETAAPAPGSSDFPF